MNEKFFKSKKEIVFTISVLVILASLIGYTYSFFSARIAKENESETILKSNTLGLTFTGIKEINCSNIVPGDECTKTFTVENTSNRAVDFNIYIENVLNEFDADLVYTLKDGDTVVINDLGAPVTKTEKQYLKKKINIESQEIKNYTMIMRFKYTDKDQNINQGKEFKGTVGIDTEIVEDEEKGYYYLNGTDVLQLFNTEKQARTYLLSNYATDYFGEEVTEAKLASGTYQTASGKIITWDKTGKFSDFLENYLKENTEFKGIESLEVTLNSSYNVGISDNRRALEFNYSPITDCVNEQCTIAAESNNYLVLRNGEGTKIGEIQPYYRNYYDFDFSMTDENIAYLNEHLNEFVTKYNSLGSTIVTNNSVTSFEWINLKFTAIFDKLLNIPVVYDYYERDDSSVLYLYDITTDPITDYGYNKGFDSTGYSFDETGVITQNQSAHLLYIDGNEYNNNLFSFMEETNGGVMRSIGGCSYYYATDNTLALRRLFNEYLYRYNSNNQTVMTYYVSKDSVKSTSATYYTGGIFPDDASVLMSFYQTPKYNISFEDSLVDLLVGYELLHK